MFDVITRALCHPQDFGHILNKHILTLSQQHDLGHSTVAFDFVPQTPLSWESGQHGIFTLPGHSLTGKRWRVFSIASSPKEGFVRIATTLPPEPSSFKRVLLELEPGDTISMRGPVGEMYVHQNHRNIVAVAGGIGITPFRAILTDFAQQLHPDCHLDLLYAGKDDFFAFAGDCTTANQLPNVTVHYAQTPEEVNAALDQLASQYKNDATYFISGSPGMIQAIQTRLQDAGIKHIINDPFKGY